LGNLFDDISIMGATYKWLWLYCLMPFVGALVAGLFYMLLHHPGLAGHHHVKDDVHHDDHEVDVGVHHGVDVHGGL